MATSSITHNFVVSKPNSVKRFVAAIDEADRDRTPKSTLPGRQLTNPQEILALMAKRKKLFSSKRKTDSWEHSAGICIGDHIKSQIFRRRRYRIS